MLTLVPLVSVKSGVIEVMSQFVHGGVMFIVNFWAMISLRIPSEPAFIPYFGPSVIVLRMTVAAVPVLELVWVSVAVPVATGIAELSVAVMVGVPAVVELVITAE